MYDVNEGNPKPTTVIATGVKNPVTDSRCKELCGMGFSLRQVQRVLPQCGWDVNMALDKLLIEGIEAEPESCFKDEPPLPTKYLMLFYLETIFFFINIGRSIILPIYRIKNLSKIIINGTNILSIIYNIIIIKSP